ncbi:MAG: hypothetical protein MUF45_11730 [Spirosomaceae bacterium]|nr:hypothetical protein [Spirosomataceae bacterium]
MKNSNIKLLVFVCLATAQTSFAQFDKLKEKVKKELRNRKKMQSMPAANSNARPNSPARSLTVRLTKNEFMPILNPIFRLPIFRLPLRGSICSMPIDSDSTSPKVKSD